MRIHACFFDRECRSVDAPWRLYIFTERLGGLSVGQRTVAWLPVLGYLPWSRWWAWWFIAYTPPAWCRKRPGWLARRRPEWYGLSRA